MKISPLPKIKLRLCVGVDELTECLLTIGQEPSSDYIHAQAYAASWVDNKRNFHGIVYLNSELKGKRLIRSVLIHEAVHVFQAYCDAINEADPSVEFQAYAVESIAGGLMGLYRKRNKAKERVMGGDASEQDFGY